MKYQNLRAATNLTPSFKPISIHGSMYSHYGDRQGGQGGGDKGDKEDTDVWWDQWRAEEEDGGASGDGEVSIYKRLLVKHTETKRWKRGKRIKKLLSIHSKVREKERRREGETERRREGEKERYFKVLNLYHIWTLRYTEILRYT